MLGSGTPAGTGCTSCRPRSSATTKRCTSKTSPCPGWPAPGSPAACTTRAGRRSRRCWNTRRGVAGARSPGWTGGSPRPGRARCAGPSARPSPCTCASGPAPAAPSTTGTSTPHATSWPRDARTAQRSWSWCQPRLRVRNRRRSENPPGARPARPRRPECLPVRAGRIDRRSGSSLAGRARPRSCPPTGAERRRAQAAGGEADTAPLDVTGPVAELPPSRVALSTPLMTCAHTSVTWSVTRG